MELTTGISIVLGIIAIFIIWNWVLSVKLIRLYSKGLGNEED